MNASDTQRSRLKERWENADTMIRTWWDADTRRASEAEVRDPAANAVWFTDDDHRAMEETGPARDEHTLLFLPFPYISAGGSEAAFPEMYCWDIHFINMALLLHDRRDLIRYHILNHLFQIERFGMVLTGNRTYYRTRSQTPLLADSIRLYCQDHIDVELVMISYPRLVKEYREYWNAPHHQTPTGLATNRDLGDPRLRPELAAEAESLDFTPCYDGDIRSCVPLQLNCALVRYADNLAWMAEVLRLPDEAEVWTRLAARRRELIRELCWDSREGFFFEYQFVRGERLPYWSLGAYWTLWAGVATQTQAAQLARHRTRFLHRGGLAQTDVAYPSPHPEFTWLQWGYPSAWPPSQMIVVEGLDRYGFHAEAEDVAVRYLDCMLTEYDRTGKFWEKYNAVEATSSLPRERTPCVPLHGWTTASAVWLGHRLYNTTAPSLAKGGQA